jgi:hypothetical protein
MFFDEAAAAFGWPEAGVSTFSPVAVAACRKLQNRFQDKGLTHACLLSRNPASSVGSGQSQPHPLAIVCEFARDPGIETLREAHGLAWNLCEGEQIVFLIADQRIIQAWSCLVPPSQWMQALLGGEAKLTHTSASGSQNEELLRSFQWVNLVGGYFQKKYAGKFNPDNRADRLLVENLRAVRRELRAWPTDPEQALPRDTCHNLLARLIFVQYLFQRADSQGRAFLNETLLTKLADQGVLSQAYKNLPDILRHKSDTYALFRWLNERFNGDLFPRAGSATLSREEKEVRASHLRCLADYLEGKTQLATGQGLLWQHYSFETIPISFISSLYEEFLTEDERGKDKAYYTPPHLVDFILDTALPWESDDWDIRVLDPCCGSGIFLVKAFQRLVHRWRRVHENEAITVPILKRLLRRNLTGVDVNPEAVRVASFSLFLAMADEIDPRQYWQTTVFPPLRGTTLIDGDFFDPHTEAAHPVLEEGGFDLILGNPPWGKNSAKPAATKWAKSAGWTPANGDTGPLFVAKSLSKLRPGGDLAMIQSAGLLMNQWGPVENFRSKLFSQARAVEVNNFSALRFDLFPKAIGPSCVLYLVNELPGVDSVITYLSPKQCGLDYIYVEPADWQTVSQRELLSAPWILTALTWGERRNVELVQRLSKQVTLETLAGKGLLKTREGIIRGNRKHKEPLPKNRKILKKQGLDPFCPVDADALDVNADPQHHAGDSSDYSAFVFPQLLLRQSWAAGPRRFLAALVDPGRQSEGILCSDSYVSVHAEQAWLDRVWLVFNSRFHVWWQMLKSGQFSTFIPKPLECELRRVPIPECRVPTPSSLSTYEEIDDSVRRAFKLSDTEWALIEDLFTFTLADFKNGEGSIGRAPTVRSISDDPVHEYATWIFRVLRSGFGAIPMAATVFREAEGQTHLPLRLLAIHLQAPHQGGQVYSAELHQDDLLVILRDLHAKVFQAETGKRAGVCMERHLRFYDSFTPQGCTTPVPTVFIAKPDRRGLWTRTQAMRDADEIAADVLANSMVDQ